MNRAGLCAELGRGESNGPGMAPDDGPRAFERFWRGDPARSGPGSGLGLSIVSGIVAAHHGSVDDNGTRPWNNSSSHASRTARADVSFGECDLEPSDHIAPKTLKHLESLEWPACQH